MSHRYRNVNRLVRVLRGVQRDEQLTCSELAERLGVGVSTVDMVYGGWRSPGPKFLRGILRAYPGLRDEVLLFLLRRISDSEDDDMFQ